MLKSVTGRISRVKNEMEEEEYLIVMERLIRFLICVSNWGDSGKWKDDASAKL